MTLETEACAALRSTTFVRSPRRIGLPTERQSYLERSVVLLATAELGYCQNIELNVKARIDKGEICCSNYSHIVEIPSAYASGAC